MINVTRGILFALIFAASASFADVEPPAEVMLFGVFHFANPGNDLVKTEQINVMTDENQAYLRRLAGRIAEFDPTVVLLEFDPESEDFVQERYEQFLDGDYELGSNEIYQLGFRIARQAGLDAVFSFDERGVPWAAEALFDYMPENDPETAARVDANIEQSKRSRETRQKTSSLADLLMDTNDPDEDRDNKSFYLMTNHVGAGDNFFGADAAASWWHRNFRMYAVIQKYAQPGERVLAIGGQGHTAILKDLLALDADRVAVDVRPYLGDP